MKTIILTAAAIALSAPAFAGSLANEIFAQSHETGDGPKRVIETSAGDVNAAVAHFAQSRETGDGARIRQATSVDVIISTSNSDLTAFAKAKLHNDERGDN